VVAAAAAVAVVVVLVKETFFCLLGIHRSAELVAKEYEECMTNKDFLKMVCCLNLI
jgi:hypothetical protein